MDRDLFAGGRLGKQGGDEITFWRTHKQGLGHPSLREDLIVISWMLATPNQTVLVGLISSIWITSGNWSESNSASRRMCVSSRKKRGPIKFLLGTSVQSSLDGEYQIDQES